MKNLNNGGVNWQLKALAKPPFADLLTPNPPGIDIICSAKNMFHLALSPATNL